MPERPQKLLEISVETDGEAAEAVCALFNQHNLGGAVVEEAWPDSSGTRVVRVKTYLSPEDSARLTGIEEALWHLGQIYPIPAPVLRWLAEAEWTEAWKSNYGVQRLGRSTVIKPSWLSYVADPGQVVIELDPGMAFGTGLHPSTRLVLEAMEDQVHAGDRVLDVGTGSGVLAISAAKRGAASVVALDIDEVALGVARENIARNGVGALTSLHRASLIEVSELDGVDVFNAHGEQNGAFDLLLMNILAPVICAAAPAISRCLASEGRLVVSGILLSQEDNVRRALSATGLTVAECHRQGDWVALSGRKEVAQSEVV